jgi:3-oxoacyl-[acyl-carrier-protein] synthase-3
MASLSAFERAMSYDPHEHTDAIVRHLRQKVEKLETRVKELIDSRGYSLGELDWIIPHQANGHIAGLFAERFPETEGRVFVTADRLGNLGSAAIWSSFDALRRSGKLERGQRVLILGAEASKYLYGGFVYTH